MKARNVFDVRRLGVLLLLVLLLLLVHARSAAAQTKSYFWQDFSTDVTIQEDGSLRVVEQQTLDFSGEPFTFGFRNIPINSFGRNDGIVDISVREGDIEYEESSSRAPHTFRTSTSGDELRIDWYFPPALGPQVYMLSYTVLGGVKSEPSGDQVFWNAMPADLGSTILGGRVRMRAPEGIDILTTTAQVGGREDEGISTAIAENRQEVLFTLTQPRPAGKDVEVGVRFESGVLNAGTPEWQQAEQFQDVFSLLILLGSIFFLIAGPTVILLWWYLRGRDPELTTPIPSYLPEPPDNTPPAIVGTLVDERAEIHDVMSTLVDLARRGYMTMTEEDDDFLFTRSEKDLSNLRPYERKTFDGIFGKSRRSRRLNELKYKFSSKLGGIQTELYKELEKDGYTKASPQSTRSRYGCLGGLLFGTAILAAFIAFGVLADSIATAFCPAFALGISGIVLIVVGQHMPRKTYKGTEAAAKWMAFKTYLEDIERYADLEKSGEIFEQYLAYAVVFGLERSWVRKFSKIPSTPTPGWYTPVFYPVPHRRYATGSPAAGGGVPSLEGMSGGMTGGLESMSSGLTRMLTSTQTVLQSTKPSSSSGGGGGFSGGFSGGSSGGGGGGFG